MKEKDREQKSERIITFDISTIEENIRLFTRFFKWSIVSKVYPKLSKVKSLEDEKSIEQFERIVKKIYEENVELLHKAKEDVEERWAKIESKIITRLQEILELNKKPKSIVGKASMLPIEPRNIAGRRFYFYAKSKCNIETTVHELLHFMWFMKWMECFPEYKDPKKQREFDSPYLVWHLSEIVPGLILNDHIIVKELDCKPRSYREYYEKKINGKSIIEHVKEIYENRKNMCDFMKKAWNFVKKNKKIIQEE